MAPVGEKNDIVSSQSGSFFLVQVGNELRFFFQVRYTLQKETPSFFTFCWNCCIDTSPPPTLSPFSLFLFISYSSSSTSYFLSTIIIIIITVTVITAFSLPVIAHWRWHCGWIDSSTGQFLIIDANSKLICNIGWTNRFIAFDSPSSWCKL